MVASFSNPEHWRSRAKQIRALADDMNDLAAKAKMMQVADQYDDLAVRAERRLRNQPVP